MASKPDIAYRLHRSAREGIETFEAALTAACEGLSDPDAKALRKEALAQVRAVKELPECGSKVVLSHVFTGTPFEGRTGTVTHHDTLSIEGADGKPREQQFARVAFDGAPVIKTRKHWAMRAGWLTIVEAAPVKEPKPVKAKATKGKAKTDEPVEAEPNVEVEPATEVETDKPTEPAVA